jgi:hypothetical protein
MILSNRSLEAAFQQIEQRISQLEQRISKQLAAGSETVEALRGLLERVFEDRDRDQEATTAALDQLQQTMRAEQARIGTMLLTELQDARARMAALIEERAASTVAQIGPQLDAIHALAQGLPGLVSEQAGQIAQAHRSEFARLTEDLARVSVEVEGALQKAAPRLASELVSAQESALHALTRKVEETAASAQRLEQSLQQSVGQIVERLETDLVALAGITHRLDATITNQLGELAPRVSALLHEISPDQVQSAVHRLQQIEALAQRLDGSVVQGFAAVAQSLEQTMQQSIGQIVERLETDLVALGQMTHRLDATLAGELGELAPRLSAHVRDIGAAHARQVVQRMQHVEALAQRLDSDVVQGFAAVVQRLETDLVRLTETVNRTEASVTDAGAGHAQQVVQRLEQVEALAQRLDSDVVQGFAAVVQRLETDLVQLAQTVHRMDATVTSNFGEIGPQVTQALRTTRGGAASRDLVQRVEETAALARRLEQSVHQGFGQIVQRLESDLVALGEATHQLSAVVAGEIDTFGSQVTGSVRQITTEASRQITHNMGELAALAQRLDSNVVQGFSSVVQRLETDLVGLSERTHELIGTVSEHSSMVAKMVVDQGELNENMRSMQRLGASGAGVSPARPREPPRATLPPTSTWVSLSESGLPATLQRKLKSHGLDGERKHWTVAADLVPRRAVELPRLLDIMRAGRAVVRPGDILMLALPFEDKPLLDMQEMQQVLGLLGPVSETFDMKDGAIRWRVAIASGRVEAMGIALRWSLAALEELNLRLGPLVREALKRSSLQDALHALDLPEPDADIAYWQSQVGTWAKLLARCEDAVPGIVLPLRFSDAPEATAQSINHVKAALRSAGVRESLAFQWVRGSVPIQLSESILAFARTHGIRFDLTVVNRGSAESRLEAYNDLLPFRSLSFDLRSPSFGNGRENPVEIARWSGRVLAANRLDDGFGSISLPGSFDRDFERMCSRLAPVLDRGAQRQFELQVNLDPTLFGYWQSYFVYNWAMPQQGWFRLFEFDASDLTTADSPLARLQRENALGADDRRRMSAASFLTLAAKTAAESCDVKRSVRDLQIEEHAYQHERMDITADAERLIEWMPEELGLTVELGCGLGVMARRIGRRAKLYVGLDLTMEQANALRETGALGLVSDIHSLPFRDGSIDTIIADNVVEHAHDPLLALRECHRVLRPGGLAYLLIPYDFHGPEFRNTAHFWKADEPSVRLAIEKSGFQIARQETVRMQELGVRGAYPSCDGYTGLWQLMKPPIQTKPVAGTADHFDLEKSRQYWRFAPSGAGKHDTTELIKLGSPALEAEWNRAFAARFRQYAEEEQFLRVMASEFSGKRVLSIGPGLGLHEVYYQLNGAKLTCCDIVPSNLAVIERVAKIKSAKPIKTILSQGACQLLGGPYDVAFIYGSLMTMPEPLQRELLGRATAALSDQGRIILMLYTWQFASATCGWASLAEFDPKAFARASDPSVGAEHCPWSDWHDDAKVEALAGPDWTISRRQLWNQGWYVWYELKRRPLQEPVKPFFDFARAAAIKPVHELDLSDLEKADATVRRTKAGIVVNTGINAAGYAVVTAPLSRTNSAARSNAILLDLDLEDGGCSVGLLDEASNSFIASHAIWQLGRAQHVFTIPPLPNRYRVIISNHRPKPQASKFTLHRVALLRREGIDASKQQ